MHGYLLKSLHSCNFKALHLFNHIQRVFSSTCLSVVLYTDIELSRNRTFLKHHLIYVIFSKNACVSNL